MFTVGTNVICAVFSSFKEGAFFKMYMYVNPYVVFLQDHCKNHSYTGFGLRIALHHSQPLLEPFSNRLSYTLRPGWFNHFVTHVSIA